MKINKCGIDNRRDLGQLQCPILKQPNINLADAILESFNNFDFNNVNLQISWSRSLQASRCQFQQAAQCPQDNQLSSNTLLSNEVFKQINGKIDIQPKSSLRIINDNEYSNMGIFISKLQNVFLRNVKIYFKILLDYKDKQKLMISSMESSPKLLLTYRYADMKQESESKLLYEQTILITKFYFKIDSIRKNRIRYAFSRIFCCFLLQNQPQNSLQFILSRINTQTRSISDQFNDLQVNSRDSRHLMTNILQQNLVKLNPIEQPVAQVNKQLQTPQSPLQFNKNIRRKSKWVTKANSPINSQKQESINKKLFYSEQKHKKKLANLNYLVKTQKSNSDFNKEMITVKQMTPLLLKSTKARIISQNAKDINNQFLREQPIAKQHFQENSYIPTNPYYLRYDTVKQQINDVSDNLIVRCIDSDPDSMFDVFVQQPYSLSNLTNMMISSQHIKDQYENIDNYQVNICPSCYRSSFFADKKSLSINRQYSQKRTKINKLNQDSRIFQSINLKQKYQKQTTDLFQRFQNLQRFKKPIFTRSLGET